jgi:hypothetical protein
MTISAVDRIRLEALLGMLGSNQVGERDNAAQLVEQFRAKRGLAWADVLGRQRLTDIPSNLQGQRPARDFSPREEPSEPRSGARDAVWRWSMLAGLIAVGSMSFASLMRHPAAQIIAVDAGMDGRCLVGKEDCAPATKASNRIKPQPSAAAALAVLAPFAQGVADRKVSETWRKSELPGLCSRRFSPDQEELKLACVTARKLLATFEQRQRSDPEYRRGWNAPPS